MNTNKLYKRILWNYNFEKNIADIPQHNVIKAIKHYREDTSIYCFYLYDNNLNEVFAYNRDYDVKGLFANKNYDEIISRLETSIKANG